MKTTRNTASKTAILDLLTQSKVALSHSEIQKLTVDLCDRVTIYRILDRLVNEDVIHKIATPDGTVKYASCHHTHDHQHHTHNHVHFNCEKCQSVTCLDSVEPKFTIPEKYLVKEVNFTLTGLCPNCS
ncbi:Fur family transcriptional regulator [Flavobacterium sp. 7A]|uniref:Fur family transcriptional regulator n=1 Tax=Flavobacterium sp. 7A TaxID=2940571 RepID=UPI002226A0B6|nr:Fur family transcriptional regulator [Flavobacterium sp. 7A]MCW2119313.1 Fur family ferric uptake transcriptional regulator [Flavobacterium sp. 7A]